MIWLFVYMLVLYGLCLRTIPRGPAGKGSDAFFVNNRRSSAAHVGLSIVASCVGGSATIGMAGLAWQVGTPAFWWLGTGAAGLTVLSLFLARKVRQSGARTMPEMITTFIGAPARSVAAVIIVLAWLSIAAAQFSAMAAIIVPLTGVSHSAALLLGAVLVIGYTALSGQAGVMRSDAFQYAVLAAALLLALSALLWQRPNALSGVEVTLFNDDFGPSRFSYFLCVLGGSYVVCPMLFGRLLSARSAGAARRGGLLAVAGLVLTAVVIVALGLACRGLVPADTVPERVLSTALMGHLPPWLASVLLLGIFSAIVSSADSCLITAATVCSNDLLRRTDMASCRLCLVGIGAGGLLLAAPGKGVLQLLLMANDIYVCGVVAPVFVGMLLHQRCTFQQHGMALAIVAGGSLGLTAALSGDTMWSYAGMGLALTLALASARSRDKKTTGNAD